MASVAGASAATLYVDAAAAADGDGSKASPFNSLSTAIEQAVDNDVINLASGTYVPALLEEPRKSTFKISGKVLTIVGGYDSKFENIEGKSVLSADVNGDDVYDESGLLIANFEDNCTRVMTVNSAANVTLKNLVLKGGYADLNEFKLDTGGAMYIGADVTMENCDVTGNYCSNSAGGGGLCVKGNLSMDNCLLAGNWGSGDGGALYIKGDINVKITNCRFEGNKSTSGSAVFINNVVSCNFSSNSFTGNTSATYGTFTVYNKKYAGTITLVNNTFAGNNVTGNTTGKTLIGGAGIYCYTDKAGRVNLVNNTIIGNDIEGYTAEGNPSEQMGGALFLRQGTTLLANNVIAGNTSLSGYGDVYKVDAAVIESKEYNFFTSYDNMSIAPDRNDIVAGIDRNGGMAKLPEVFACELAGSKINAKCVNNGGSTKTVEVIGANVDFDGLTISSVPAANLSETDLGVDLNGDGAVDGFLAFDQRGAARNLDGQAYMGAYEYDKDFTGVENVALAEGAGLKIRGGLILVPSDREVEYAIYSLTGQSVLKGTANSVIDASSLQRGVYVVRVVEGAKVYTLKFNI